MNWKRQQDNEKLRVDFADKALKLNNYLKDIKKKVSSIGGDLKAALATTKEAEKEHKNNQDKLDAVLDLDKKMQDAHVIENKHTTLSAAQLKMEYSQIITLIGRNIQLLEKEIKMQANTGISAELLQEFKELFVHFDTDKKGALDRNEFKNSVQSLGEQLSKQEIEDLFLKADKDKSNTISFDEFTKIMADRMTDNDTEEEVLGAFKMLTGGKEFVIAENLTDVVKPDLIQYLTETMPKKEVTPGAGEKVPANPKDFEKWTHDVFLR